MPIKRLRKKSQLPTGHLTDVYVHKWIKGNKGNQQETKKKEEEVQNTPTLKSGRQIKSQYLHDTRIWPVNWFQKFYIRGTIFYLCYAFAIA